MAVSEPFTLTDYIKRIKSLRVTQLREFDAILSELANHLHELDESLSEKQKKIKSIDPAKKKTQLLVVLKLQLKLDELSELLWQTGYEGHYMDRCVSILGSVSEDMEKVIEELKE
jgi:tRNA(Phe) wybutosine-synthesizing methylase Tyw3